MRSIAKLFGKSPFVPLQVHMDKVADCVEKVPAIMDAYLRGDQDRVNALAEEISSLEHAADEVKHDIQNHLPRGMFLAVDRGKLLEILSVQDSIADKAENLGALLTLKAMASPPEFETQFQAFLKKNMQAFEAARGINRELDELLTTSFGGAEAHRVVDMVQTVAKYEHEADRLQHDLLKSLFANEGKLSHGEFYLWTRIFRQVSELSNLSERLANRVRTLLTVK